MRILRASILIWGSATFAHAAELELPGSKPGLGNDPCRVENIVTEGAEKNAPIQVSRRGAVYVIRHIHRACQYLADMRDIDARSDAIRSDLYDSLVRPIHRAHPSIADILPQPSSPPKVFQATARDIERATANRLDDEITRLQVSIAELGKGNIGRSADESAAKKALESIVDATTELAFAVKVAHDAYPDLFAKSLDVIPVQPRTAERDAAFRKGAPPKGSVRLSNAALALVQSFMRDVDRISGRENVAWLGWAREQKSKGPSDMEWSKGMDGWVLGAYRRNEVPPDVVDTVRGIEIIFTAEDPSALAGKTFDATRKKLFVRD